MVFPPLVSLVAAAAVALLSTSVVLYKRGVSLPLIGAKSSQNQADKVLFTLTPAQRDSLMLQGGTLDDINTTNDIRDAFHTQGYVIIRGLLNDTMLDRLDAAGIVFLQQHAQAKPQTFSALKFGPVYLSPPNSTTFSDVEDLSAFRQVAMESAIPAFIAQVLLELQPSTQTLRVLKDVFLSKGNETDYCGWHVDDQTFWPIKYSPTAKPGVNAWIAMDDIPSKHGGGLAVSPQSHIAEWRRDAYQTIGSTPTYPDEGYDSPGKMFESYKTTTCNLAKAAPKLAKEIDDSMHVFDFQKGDVLIHTRWLFHRSVPLTEEGAAHFESLQEAPVMRRYSIRYEVGSAQLLEGFTMEPSIVLERTNAGKTLDQVSEKGGSPWYPQCWPTTSEMEMEHLREITENKLPEFEPLKKELFQQVLPYFKKS